MTTKAQMKRITDLVELIAVSERDVKYAARIGDATRLAEGLGDLARFSGQLQLEAALQLTAAMR